MPTNYNPYSFGHSGTNPAVAGYNSRPTYTPAYGSTAFGSTPGLMNPNPSAASEYPMPQQNTQPAYLPIVGLKGRMVTKEEDITAGEIPMDNSLSLFPLADYSCIYAKQWSPNGQVITVKYVPEVQAEKIDEVTITDGPTLEELSEQLNEIKSMLQKQNRPRNSTYKKNQNGSNFQRKEVDNA